MAERESRLDRKQTDGAEEWVPAGLERRDPPPPLDDDGWTVRPSANGSRRPAGGARAPASSGIDLNTASFEVLRSCGLSVTQAKRFLTHRERTGGLRSIEEVDQLAGFPRDLKAWLRSHGRV
jgi:hypothetical protein